MKANLFKASLLLIGVSAFPGMAAAQSAQDKQIEQSDPAAWRLITGVNYSTGDYGDTRDTEVLSAPVGLKYSKGKFTLRVSTSFVRISGPGSLIDTPQGRDNFGGLDDSGGGGSSNSGSGSSNSGSGSSNSGSGSSNSGSGSSGSGSSGSGSSGSGSSGSGSSGSGSSGSGSSGSGSSGSGGSGGSGAAGGGDVTPNLAPSNTRSGVGDVSVTLGYSFDFGSDTYLDVSGRVKLPTASKAKRLGTGKADFTVGADLVKDIGNISIYAGGRRKFTGTAALRDVWGFGGGFSAKVSDGTLIGADYDWQQSSSVGNGPSSEITGWTSFRVSPRLRLQLFASTGFTTNSADFSGGMSISYRFK